MIEEQYDRIVAKATRLVGGSLVGATVALWGLTFKARTDDLRESPSLEIARRLAAAGARIRGCDPIVHGPLSAEWDEFRWLDFDKVGSVMAARAVLDTRKILEPAALRRHGFVYEGVGLA